MIIWCVGCVNTENLEDNDVVKKFSYVILQKQIVIIQIVKLLSEFVVNDRKYSVIGRCIKRNTKKWMFLWGTKKWNSVSWLRMVLAPTNCLGCRCNRIYSFGLILTSKIVICIKLDATELTPFLFIQHDDALTRSYFEKHWNHILLEKKVPIILKVTSTLRNLF